MIIFAIIGNLGRVPSAIRTTASGSEVTTFSVASNRKYTDSAGNPQKETTWLNVSVWGKQAHACLKYLEVGSKVCVEGRLVVDKETGSPRIWFGDDGKARASFEMSASNVEFLDKAPATNHAPPDDDDDIEF